MVKPKTKLYSILTCILIKIVRIEKLRTLRRFIKPESDFRFVQFFLYTLYKSTKVWEQSKVYLNRNLIV